MKHIILIPFFIAFFVASKAEKTEKKGFLFNRNCRPLGANHCETANISQDVPIIYLFNENNDGQFIIQIAENDVNQNKGLNELFSGKRLFEQEEDFIPPADLIMALKLPSHFKVLSGSYPIEHRNGLYRINFTR